MKKIIVAIAAVILMASCGSKSPVDKVIDKMGDMIEVIKGVDLTNITPDKALELQNKVTTIQKEVTDLINANKDYKLTAEDKDNLKKFMTEMGEAMGEKPSAKDLEELDKAVTLGDALKDFN